MARLVLEELSKRFDNVQAVDNVSLTVEDGEFLVVVGSSGCGKTTLMRCIAGLETIDGGRIHIGGRIVNETPPKDRGVSMVFQDYALYPHMTVFDNIAFPLTIQRVPKAEKRQRVIEAATMFQLDPLLQRKPGQLSGGQQQRTALARAIVRTPSVFLFDEPLSNLDAKLRGQARADIITLHKRIGVPSVYVTHDQVEAMTMGERIAVMKSGILQQVGTPDEVYNSPANMFVADFIGSPSMNLMNAALENDGSGGLRILGSGFSLTVPDEASGKVKAYAGKRVIFGLRPEHIYLRNLSPVEASPANTITAKVDLVEPLGTETIIHLATGDEAQPLKMLVAGGLGRIAAGQNLELICDMSRAHIFDVETELAVI